MLCGSEFSLTSQLAGRSDRVSELMDSTSGAFLKCRRQQDKDSSFMADGTDMINAAFGMESLGWTSISGTEN